MQEYISEFYSHYGKFVVTFHVLGAMIWVGGMVAFLAAVFPSMKQIKNEKIMVLRTLDMLSNYFLLILPFVFLMIATALIMNIAIGFDNGHPAMSTIVNTKEALWFFMFLIYIYTYYKKRETKKMFLDGDETMAVDSIKLIINYFFPISIFLGIIAIYLGLILRGM